MQKLKYILPGLLLSSFLTIISIFLARFLPYLGASSIALFLGIILGNLFFQKDIFHQGTKFAETNFLAYAVVLLGLTINFQDIFEIGIIGIIFVIFQIITTLYFTIFLGKKLGFSEKFATLMATGNAICGSSAIASVAPTISANEEDKINAITLVNLMGTIMMFLLVFIAALSFQNSPLLQGAFIGGVLQSVGQVVASASMLNESVVKYATIFKIIRILFLVVIVLYFGGKYQKKQNIDKVAAKKQKGSFFKSLPWYVLGFILCCCLNSFLTLPQAILAPVKSINTYFEITALAAIGLRLDIMSLLSKGKALLLYGFGIGIFQISSALLFIFILFKIVA